MNVSPSPDCYCMHMFYQRTKAFVGIVNHTLWISARLGPKRLMCGYGHVSLEKAVAVIEFISMWEVIKKGIDCTVENLVPIQQSRADLAFSTSEDRVAKTRILHLRVSVQVCHSPLYTAQAQHSMCIVPILTVHSVVVSVMN